MECDESPPIGRSVDQSQFEPSVVLYCFTDGNLHTDMLTIKYNLCRFYAFEDLRFILQIFLKNVGTHRLMAGQRGWCHEGD